MDKELHKALITVINAARNYRANSLIRYGAAYARTALDRQMKGAELIAQLRYVLCNLGRIKGDELIAARDTIKRFVP